jgi:spermidine synthase
LSNVFRPLRWRFLLLDSVIPSKLPLMTHVKPVVYETLTSKSLFFSLRDVQSRMDIEHPYALQFDYTKIMMGFLLHNPQPLSIAMVGLGGGSLAKFCYRYLRQSRITVIEINPHVIALRDDFALPIDDERFSVHLADAAHFIQNTESKFDVVLADGFDIDGLPEQLSSSQFYDDCYDVLNPGGIFVANLHGCNLLFDLLLDRIQASFKGSLLTVNDPSASNRLAFAVKDGAHALSALGGVRRPAGMDEWAWSELMPSMARVFLASRELARNRDALHHGAGT